MATITKLRTLVDGDDIKAVLSNSNPGRLLSIGTNWTQLRIGVRLCVDGTASITGTPIFAMGLCSGVTNRWDNGGGPTTHFVGASTLHSLWNYSSGIYFVNSGTLDWRVTKRVGTTITYGLQMPSVLLFPSVGLGKRWIYFLDITKGSPNFTLNYYGITNSACVDITKDVLIASMAIVNPGLSNNGAGTARTLAVDESADGPLNAVCLGWNRTTPTIEISDIAIARFA